MCIRDSGNGVKPCVKCALTVEVAQGPVGFGKRFLGDVIGIVVVAVSYTHLDVYKRQSVQLGEGMGNSPDDGRFTAGFRRRSDGGGNSGSGETDFPGFGL